ncbi:MAG: hypothetical protein WCD79_11430 [Chthoniobacteraceae bacterium]
METPDQLRPLLHRKIDGMDAEHLAVLHRALLQFEADELAEKLGAEFDEDRRSGRLDRLAEIIREYRMRRRAA